MRVLEDIEVYKFSLSLAKDVYTLTRHQNIHKDLSLTDQMRRASLSVPANIAEGFGRKSKNDFAHFLSIALGSTNEMIAYLDFISLEYNVSTDLLKQEYKILAKRIFSFRSYLLQTTNH